VPKTPEGKIKDKVKALLKEFGDECYSFMPVQTGYGKPGLDFHLCFRGHAVFIETKSPSGQLTANQRLTCHDVAVAGGATFVIRDDEGLNKLRQFLCHLSPARLPTTDHS
jgi:hypothetical protein